MTGGLINIVTYGSQDLFLTGTPEITHFRVVYRRHTNFSMESMRVKFDDPIAFDNESSLIIPKIGDLIHKMYLEITLPEIKFTRSTNSTVLLNLLKLIDKYQYYEKNIRDYFYLFMTKYNQLNDIYEAENGTYTSMINLLRYQNINNSILLVFPYSLFDYNLTYSQPTVPVFDDTCNISSLVAPNSSQSNYNPGLNNPPTSFIGLDGIKYDTSYNTYTNGPNFCLRKFLIDINNDIDKDVSNNKIPADISGDINYYGPYITQVAYWDFFYNQAQFYVNGAYSKDLLKLKMDITYKSLTRILNKIQDTIIYLKEQYDIESTAYYKFAWVKRLGHSMIDYVDLHIAGDRIDRLYGDWINIWYELTSSKEKDEIYKKMIGDLKELTTFDRTIKPKTTIYVPLPFWFSKYNGLALPLVAMQYNDVLFQVRFRKFQDVAYIENYNSNIDINLDDMFENENYYLDAALLVDYIYLDAPERRKFAQHSHEYLIDYTQIIDKVGITQQEYSVKLDYSNPIKEIIWVAQRNSFIENFNGYTETMFYNYGINNDGTDNPIINTKMEMHGYITIEESDGNLFNYVYPEYFHKNTPDDGINVYSFSLNPEEHQPAGSCNFSRLTSVTMTFNFNENMFTKDGEDDSINLRIYAVTYNILRIIGGYGALAFV